MTFQWQSENHIDEDLYKFCVELEFKLRPKITRFLINRLEKETGGEFSAFYFDIDLDAGSIAISGKTPALFRIRIEKDFDREINRNFVQRFFDMNSRASVS